MDEDTIANRLFALVCVVGIAVGVVSAPWYAPVLALVAFLVAAYLTSRWVIRDMNIIPLDTPKGRVLLEKCHQCKHPDAEFVRALLSPAKGDFDEKASQAD